MISFLIASYLIGNIMTGFFIVKVLGRNDIRLQGSGNVGARNAGRILGKKAFILTFLGDAAKGAIVIAIGRYLHLSEGIQLAGLTIAIIGHIKPILLRFQGGKGISTFIGGMIFFEPIIVPVIIIGFLIFYLFIKSFTLSGLGAFLFIPLALYFLQYSQASLLIVIGIIIVLYFAHIENIKERLRKT
jgi:acyl phosphate:glycerol-3-phosphate acyltransferase